MKAKKLVDTKVNAFAQEAFAIAGKVLQPMQNRVPAYFTDMVNHIISMDGKLIISGMGKSAIIAQKIVATFNSLGVSSVFLHAADALHGDVGIVKSGDVFIVLSKSGESEEIKAWLPQFKNKNHKIIAIVGNTKSSLAREADWILDASVEREICPLNLAPTTSAMAQMLWGDVLATSLTYSRDFTKSDFAINHPGGMLGKEALLTCQQLAKGNIAITVNMDTNLVAVIGAISKSLMGAVTVVDQDSKVLGIITDGDLRRHFVNMLQFEDTKAEDLMTNSPIFVEESTLVKEAFDLMKKRDINQLILTNNQNVYVGMIHIHQILKAGFSN